VSYLEQLSEEGIPCTFTWHTAGCPCPRCAALDGRIWIGRDIEAAFLVDEVEGAVWNLDDNTSFMHPNCKCSIEVQPEIDEERIAAEVNEVFYTTGLVKMAQRTDIQNLRLMIRESRSELGAFRYELMEVNILLGRFAHIARDLGLPPEISGGIQKLERLVMLTTQMIYFMGLLQKVMYGSMGPVGWALMITSGIITAMSAGEMVMESLG